ncbi:MAG: BatD family protein [Pseudomonadota bacterium]
MVKRFFPAVLKRVYPGLGAILALFTAFAVSAAEIEVSVDRNPVQLNESFQIIFSATGEPDGEPVFTPLDQDFEIINRGQTSSISVINGAYSKTLNWNLTVMAKRAGALTIPAVSFGQDLSRPLSLLVKEGAPTGRAGDHGGSELFLEVEAEPRNPYVQSQVLYTIRLFRRVEITQARLGEPVLSDAVVGKLGEDVGYTTERNGLQYAVTERNYAIFPQKSGKATIPPMELTAQRIVSGRSGLRFDGFFGRQTTRATRLTSNPIALDVRPVPESFRGAHWLPAENLTLRENWSEAPGQLVVGEPVTRTLSLTADGATMGLLPEIAGSAALSVSSAVDKLNRYPDQPVLNEAKKNTGVHSFREEKTALIATEPGRFILPAIEIPWWNTRTDRMETARIPERVVEAVYPPGRAVTAAASSRRAETPMKVTPAASEEGKRAPGPDSAFWMWLSLFLAVIWMITLLAWWLSRKNIRDGNRSPADSQAPKKRQQRDAVRNACKRGDPTATKNALLAWAGLQWSGASPVTSLSAIAERCPGDLGPEIQRLSRVLYGREKTDWSGDRLWALFKAFEGREGKGRGKKTETLEPLFRL